MLSLLQQTQTLLLLLLLLLAAGSQLAECRLGFYPRPSGETPQFWREMGRQRMEQASRVWENLRYRAKNAILFVGDGMGVSTVTAGRILKGQVVNGSSGEEAQLEFDSYPHVGLSKTYNVDRQTPDSAATATAFLCGVKNNYGMLGIDQNVPRFSCSGYNPSQHRLVSFLELAERQGKSVGVVTTTRLTHATPAAAYAKSPDRYWESDTDRDDETRSPDTREQRRACTDIATQMVENGVNFTVMLGGGRLKFLPKNETTFDPVINQVVSGERSDGVNLISRWHQMQQRAGRRALYVENTTQLLSLNPSDWDSVLGLMATSHLEYDIDNQKSSGYKQPSLAEMTEAAIKMLQKNSRGFVLLVEGGRIDHGHHGSRAQRALHDVLALDKAVGVANRMTSDQDTLIAVTADHGHVFTIGHYAHRGQPVLGRRLSSSGRSLEMAADAKPYTVLNYADGPGAAVNAERRNISGDAVDDNQEYRYQALVPFSSESHSGEDVSIHARGPGAQLFHSVHEQSEIAHAFMKAVCLGWYAENGRCLTEPRQPTTTTANPNSATQRRISAAAVAAAAAAVAASAAIANLL